MHDVRHARSLRHTSPGTLAILVAFLSFSPAAAAAEEPSPHASLTLERQDGSIVPLPLERTEVRAEISAFVASVSVIQTFGNPFDEPIEAIYLFPLPERAAVDDFLLEVGERRVRGEIKRRDDAERIYSAARAAGHTAARRQQERPNIFTQKVANILPGESIRVHLRYIDRLPYEAGSYRFLFPMVVGPRFVPQVSAAGQAPEAERIDAPVLRPGYRSAHDIALTVAIDAGVPLRSVTSESHEIVVEHAGSRARVGLVPHDTIPNKDFMLRIEVAGELPEVGVLAHRTDDEGFFSLLIQPKAEVTVEEAAPKEILFVLDESGSMSGLPIDMSKRFMRESLKSLGPEDRFNIIKFSGSADVLSPAPLENTTANVTRGLRAIEKMAGSGGTQMLAGFRAAFEQPHDPHTIRIVFFLTDGFIGNEEQIFEAIRTHRGEARVFTLGIGSSVNHYLLREMAALGDGAYQYIRPDGDEKEAVDRFHRWATRPYLTDLEIDWGSLPVQDVQPERLPDLYSGQTLPIVGRYLWGSEETVIIRGRLGGVPWEKEIMVTLPETADSHAAIGSVWAREKIRTLLLEPDGTRPEIRAQVTSLALAFRLMSPFTSFVAVDEERVANPDGAPRPVEQAIPLPEFVSFTGTFGEEGPFRDGPLIARPAQALAAGVAGEVSRTAPPASLESAETIVIVTRGNVVDTENSKTSTAYNAELIEERPIIGHNYQDILTLAPGVTDTDGDGNPNVHGARETGLQYRLDGGNITDPVSGTMGQNLNADILEEVEVITSGASDEFGRADGGFANVRSVPGGVIGALPTVEAVTPPPLPTALKHSDHLELSLSILADILDDGKLSRSEGLPALAGLLAIQYSDGAFTLSIKEQAIAAWALAEVARAQPDLPWIAEAARRAREFLETNRLDDGTWPSIAGGERDDAEASRWARLAIDAASRTPILHAPLKEDLRELRPEREASIDRILEDQAAQEPMD